MVVVKCHHELLSSDGLNATGKSASDVARSRDLQIAACCWEEAMFSANEDLSMGCLSVLTSVLPPEQAI